MIYPEKNSFFDAVKHHGLSIVKMRTAQSGSVALLSKEKIRIIIF